MGRGLLIHRIPFGDLDWDQSIVLVDDVSAEETSRAGEEFLTTSMQLRRHSIGNGKERRYKE